MLECGRLLAAVERWRASANPAAVPHSKNTVHAEARRAEHTAGTGPLGAGTNPGTPGTRSTTGTF